MAGLIVSAALSLSMAAPSYAAITYTAQERYVEIFAFVNNNAQGSSERSFNFNPFNRSTSFNFTESAGSAFASQNSSLLPDRITMGSFTRVTQTTVIGLDEGRATSFLSVTFSLDSASGFLVQQSRTPSGDSNPYNYASARLTGPGGVVFDWLHTPRQPITWPDGDYSGTLQPGQHTLRVEVFADRSSLGGRLPGTNSMSASFVLIIPSPSLGPAFCLAIALGSLRRRRAG
ncbi:MAG: hypothetical protein IT438_07680 [Phycisphaerales bacterium]|nr:hypothetical protein [Phycisphaerales bacterium]